MIATNTISLRVKLLAAIATAQSPITGHYVGMTTAGLVSTVQAIHINTNSTTAVTIVPNSTAGNVNILKNLQVSNADTASITVIVEQWDGVTAKVMATVPLVVNQYLTIDSDGKITVSTTGGVVGTGTVTQVQGNGTVNGLTLTGNVTTSGNLTLGGNLTGTASGLIAGNVTNIPNLSGAITGNSTGATALTASGFSSTDLFNALTNKTGTGLAVFGTNCTLNTPNLTTPSAVNLTNALSLPIPTGLSDTAWVSWTPTFTNFTLGNGTVDAKYKTIGKTVFFRVQIILGSTSSMGTAPYFTNPVTSIDYADTLYQTAFGMILNAGVGNYQALVRFRSTTTISIAYLGVTGVTVSTSGGITSTTPHTWKSTDKISFQGFYEIP